MSIIVICSAILQIDGKREKRMKKYYVEKPELKPYEGIIINKNTKLEYKNDMLEQKLENLKFVSKFVKDTKRYKTTSIVEINLEEGEVLLLEEEGRGYFLPADSTPVEEIDEAINDYKSLKEALTGKEE